MRDDHNNGCGGDYGVVRLALATILEKLRKSSDSGRESSENRRLKYVYTINRILHARFVDMNFIFSCSTRRCRVEHSKIKFISTRGHVISSISLLSVARFKSRAHYL